MSMTGTPVDNGVNVAALLGAREALTAAPEAAQFQWRASCTWQNGTHSHSTVEGFFGLGEEQHHTQRVHASTPTTPRSSPPRTTGRRRSSTCSSAWPAASPPASPPSPRTARSSCARCRRPSRATWTSRGILGIDSDVRNGFSGIKVTYDIDADATPDEIKALVAQSQKRSAVYDIITNPTNVTVEVR